MSLVINELDKKNEIDELTDFVSNFDLGENIDYGCCFLSCKDNDKIVAITGWNEDIKFNTDRKIALFEHIILDPKYHRKGWLFAKMMRESEKLMRIHGFIQYVSYILNTKKLIQQYAIRWGMKPYKKTEEGIWFYKNL